MDPSQKNSEDDTSVNSDISPIVAENILPTRCPYWSFVQLRRKHFSGRKISDLSCPGPCSSGKRRKFQLIRFLTLRASWRAHV